MITFLINENDSELVKHIKNEANYAIQVREEQGESIRRNDIVAAANALLRLTDFSEDYPDLRAYVSSMTNFLRFGIFSPLTLKEGEFIYKRYGLAQNIRNPYVYKDLTSVFYSNAYTVEVEEYYDAKNDVNYQKETKGLDELKPFSTGDMPRVYFVKGSFYTKIYFDKAYLKDEQIKEGWYPKPAHVIKVLRCFVDDKYIDFCYYYDAKVNALLKDYNLHIEVDDNPELEQFGLVTSNITKDVLLSKRSSF